MVEVLWCRPPLLPAPLPPALPGGGEGGELAPPLHPQRAEQPQHLQRHPPMLLDLGVEGVEVDVPHHLLRHGRLEGAGSPEAEQGCHRGRYTEN